MLDRQVSDAHAERLLGPPTKRGQVDSALARRIDEYAEQHAVSPRIEEIVGFDSVNGQDVSEQGLIREPRVDEGGQLNRLFPAQLTQLSLSFIFFCVCLWVRGVFILEGKKRDVGSDRSGKTQRQQGDGGQRVSQLSVHVVGQAC